MTWYLVTMKLGSGWQQLVDLTKARDTRPVTTGRRDGSCVTGLIND